MKVLYEIYDFITGGSIVTPIGVAVTIIMLVLTHGQPGVVRGCAMVAMISVTLGAALYERVA